MQNAIQKAIDKIDSLGNKPIKVFSHNDTDGITSASIFSRALQRWEKNFSLQIVKSLEKQFIEALPEDHILIFLDLASNFLETLSKKNTEVIILDHHEISMESVTSNNIILINPILERKENICAAAICYLFAKQLEEQNKDLSNLAVIGMVGDLHESNLNKTYSEILKDADVSVKKGILLYPATRPIDKVLENSFGIFIPGVTGSLKGTIDLLKDAQIEKSSKGFKSVAELTEEEMSRLTDAILLRKKEESQDINQNKIIGNIYLIKFFNQLEDARELSALINACSRMDYPDASIGLCLGNKNLKSESIKIYTKYKKAISTALNDIQSLDKIEGKKYTIINSQDKIKDTLAETITSIISFSPLYKKGTIIINMAHSGESMTKVSARVAGKEGRDVRKVLTKAVSDFPDHEVGGHPIAAGCSIKRENEEQFIENLKKILEIEMVKV